MPPDTALVPTPPPLELMGDLSHTTIIESAEPLARLSRRSFEARTDRRGSALDR